MIKFKGMEPVKISIPRTSLGTRNPVWRYFPHNLNTAMHYMTRHKWNQRWKEQVWGSVKENLQNFPKPMPYDKTEVQIVFNTCSFMDDDNAHTSAKPLLDGLKYAGVIKDDSHKHIELKVSQISVHKRDRQGIDIYIKKVI